MFEGMEESGSEGLDGLIFERKDTFFEVLLNFFFAYIIFNITLFI